MLYNKGNALERNHETDSKKGGSKKWVKYRNTHHRSTSERNGARPSGPWPATAPIGSPRRPESAKPRKRRNERKPTNDCPHAPRPPRSPYAALIISIIAQIAWRPSGAIVEQRIVRLASIHDSTGNCNAKRRLCATLKSECPIKGTATYC